MLNNFTKLFRSLIYFEFIFICFGQVTQAQNKQAEADMKKLVNFNRMEKKHYAVFQKQRVAQYTSWEENAIPKNFQIPVELISFRPDNSVRYYVIYNPVYKTGVGYIPSNLVRYYEEEAWKAFQELGQDAPSLSIVLAQQFTESAFNPWAIGDNGKSCGLPQLYRTTAKVLYKTDKATWKNYFYFDKKGTQHFTSVRAMVQFPFVFLPNVKQYNAENKFEGIRRYNGEGQSAIEYADKVMKRSLFYEELFALYNEIPLDTLGFKNNLFGMINLTLLARNEEPINHAKMDQLFASALAEYTSGYVHKTYAQYYELPVSENQLLLAAAPTNYTIPSDGKEYYLILEEGRVIYQYFNDSQVLFDVLNHPKNKAFYLYYKENGKKITITNLVKVGKRQIYSNTKPGDKIYIPSGTILLSPETNLAVRIN